MKKRFNFGRLGALALALTLVTSCLTGGTLAKYTTSVDGTGTAMVAKWAFKAGSTDGGTSISTFKLTDTTVGTGVAAEKIAPGTKGEIPIYVDLTDTEVATEIKVDISVTDDTNNLPNNLKFTLNDQEINAGTLEKGTDTNLITVSLSAKDAAKYKENLSINWEWPFNTTGGDTSDKNNGEDAETSNIKVTVTGTQLDKDPESSPTP
ncbi:hypothetical protein K040078D81_51340 [Blautia hominis]|uniref:Lipoprotein n=1 Tax=Blautia hominis TaxID=2025493 RepID=A0ABQ0BHT5_9FIRM